MQYKNKKALENQGLSCAIIPHPPQDVNRPREKYLFDFSVRLGYYNNHATDN